MEKDFSENNFKNFSEQSENLLVNYQKKIS